MIKPTKIKVSPIAFESLGVRSMCTLVETSDIKVLLDAGVSLGPNRYGFPPHPQEYRVLKERRNLMLEVSKKTDIVTISHFHFDHHTPSFDDWAFNWSSAEIAENIYGDKIVLTKSYKSKINPSQRQRGWMFNKTGGKHAARLAFADGKTFKFRDTTIKFSTPVFHGQERSELGWVLMSTIKHEGENVLFAPDVQGPMYEKTLKMILAEKPCLVIVGGPPLYLPDFLVSQRRIDSAMRNLESIVKQVPLTILDHHILRDENWKETAQPVFDTALSMGHKVVTAAEFACEKDNLLELRRRTLFETDPPSQEFIKWTKALVQEKKLTPPPI